MPELPEVESVRKDLLVYEGQTISNVIIHDGWMRKPIPHDIPSKIIGKKINTIIRKSKYLLWEITDSPPVLLHLGMSGYIESRSRAIKHDKISWHFNNKTSLYFNDARRFGLVTWAHTYKMPSLGPEPLSSLFTSQYFVTHLSKRSTPIKVALLDQSLVAGLGNIYACEALYDAGISPLRLSNQLTTEECKKLHFSINKIIARAIELSGSTWRDYKKPNGQHGRFQHEFSVYDREGELTQHGIVERIKQAGRSTYYCPNHQK